MFNRLDDLSEGMYSLGIEACRYKDHWPDTFGEVLREEGLFALNALAAAFPPMEDYDKFCAVVEYADANTSKEYIALAEHLDEFEFFPGARDLDDMAETWIDAHPYLNLGAELEEYFDYSAYGGDPRCPEREKDGIFFALNVRDSLLQVEAEQTGDGVLSFSWCEDDLFGFVQNQSKSGTT